MGDTDFLFSRPSFLEGVGSTIDLFGTLREYNKSITPEDADSRAMWHDFKAIGLDIWNIINGSVKKVQQ
jgi:hypothetical protein